MGKIQSIRGMNDILASETHNWQYLESVFRQVVQSYGFHEIRTPIVENTNLFTRPLGEVTDIVEKEMYTFADRNGDSLTLRPEGTVSVVRAIIENGLLQERLKLWYYGAMFRYERPQKGRFRQFHQLGCEVFNITGAEIDAELIVLSARLWQQLDIKDVELQINSLGSNQARAKYREVLVQFFSQHKSQLDEDSKRRLTTNPLRILDSKNPQIQDIIKLAPKLADYLDDESRQHFARLCQLLTSLEIPFVINNRLVRGMDYYNQTVFEWVSNNLGAQGTICAGGRYDGLVAQVGGKSTPAVGFAIGVERLLSLIDLSSINSTTPDIYLISQGDTAQQLGLKLAENLRQHNSNLIILTNFDGGSFKAQFKRADKSNAKFAFIIGENEINNGTVAIKNLRQSAEQQTVVVDEINSWLQINNVLNIPK